MTTGSLPPLQLIDVDPVATQNNIITTYEAITGRKLFPADPERLFLLSLAQIIIHQKVLLNDTAKQNHLRYARGHVLDHKGDGVRTPRQDEEPAKTTVRWWLSGVRQEVVTIPAGTRVSPGKELFFKTTQSIEIPAGNLYSDVICECLQAGSIGNGFIPGQINLMVDPLPWIQRVENITESAGGTNREEDDSYRERIREAPESFSTAGPDGAYLYWAKAAHPDIQDVKVYSPSDGVVELRILMNGGKIPSSEILDAVREKCNDRKVRPLTDKLQVFAAEEVKYNLDMTYWIDKEDIDSASVISAAVEKAVTDYILWQKSKLGRDINPSELTFLVRSAGAKRIEIRSPEFASVSSIQFASAEVVNLVYGGIEDA